MTVKACSESSNCHLDSLGRKWFSMSAYGTMAAVCTPLITRPKLRLHTHIRAHLNSSSEDMEPNSGTILQMVM